MKKIIAIVFAIISLNAFSQVQHPAYKDYFREHTLFFDITGSLGLMKGDIMSNNKMLFGAGLDFSANGFMFGFNFAGTDDFEMTLYAGYWLPCFSVHNATIYASPIIGRTLLKYDNSTLFGAGIKLVLSNDFGLTFSATNETISFGISFSATLSHGTKQNNSDSSFYDYDTSNYSNYNDYGTSYYGTSTSYRAKTVHVRSYTRRQNGKIVHVKSHYRSAPRRR